MTQTERHNRVNVNYRIVDSIHVGEGEAEFVLGVHTVLRGYVLRRRMLTMPGKT